jgi:hypothetical protein
MNNPELTKHYLNLVSNPNKMSQTAPADIISALDNHFNCQWAWELADEKIILDNTMLCTTVTVYVPGRVLTGRSITNGYNTFATNHLIAIYNACKNLMIENTSINTPSVTQQVQQMTSEQIMNAINQQPVAVTQQPTVESIAQMPAPLPQPVPAMFMNQPIPGMPDEVPFDMAVDTIQQGMNAAIPQQPVSDDTYDKPLEKYKGFSQRQIDRLNKFKVDFDIINDEMFGNFVNTWNKNLSSKSDIVPSNANDFLDWAENLGKMAC